LVEAYLAVQANLELSTARGTPRSLAVTSTRPREGKSTTATALAQSLARAHRKVVLVDADLRSPSVHSAFGVANEAGVSNFLAGSDDLDASIHATSHEGLSVMPAGPPPPNAADLLTGERLRVLIERLQERFDHVIVDSPPVIGLADAPLVASAVEAVIFVVEARSTQAGVVRNALNRLATAHANVLGAVLTKFEAKRAHLGYGYGYGYEYGYGR
jgi:capsular exopolysaccharide synthesis family protein